MIIDKEKTWKAVMVQDIEELDNRSINLSHAVSLMRDTIVGLEDSFKILELRVRTIEDNQSGAGQLLELIKTQYSAISTANQRIEKYIELMTAYVGYKDES